MILELKQVPVAEIPASGTFLFRRLLTEVVRAEEIPLSLYATSYLVEFLNRHITNTELVAFRVADHYIETCKRSGGLAATRTRAFHFIAAEACLFIEGMLPEVIERRGLESRFYAEWGEGFYRSAAKFTPVEDRYPIVRLAQEFDAMAWALFTVREWRTTRWSHLTFEQWDLLRRPTLDGEEDADK